MNERSLSSLTPEERKSISEQLISELYIDLRCKVNKWALLTKQTSQARMGYVGQHLVSIVTGLEGSRTGARGDDLVYPDRERHSEVKTCYRVDQLGECLDCGFKVAASDTQCPSCGSLNLKRKDDSKWLISLPADPELAHDKFVSLFSNESFFLVLFEFEDLHNPDVINALIWEVDPKYKGFSYCMLDYYKNIWAESKSHAAFNLWPYLPKFYLMRPKLIYHARILHNNTVDTVKFPGINEAELSRLPPLTSFARSTGFSQEVCQQLVSAFNIRERGRSKRNLLSAVEEYRNHVQMSDDSLREQLIMAFYSDVTSDLSLLPENCR